MLNGVQKWDAEVPNDGGVCQATFKSYPWETGFRFVVNLPKQRVYFELMDTESFNSDEVVEYFISNRLNMTHAKCCRCGNWNVVEGLMCPRCTETTNRGGAAGDVWYQIENDCKKTKI